MIPETAQNLNPEIPTNPQAPANPIAIEKPTIAEQFKQLSRLTKASLIFAIFIALVFVVLLIVTLSQNPSPTTNPSDQKTATDLVAREKQKQLEASLAALRQQSPQNQLQKAYDDAVGSNSSKRSLSIDANGVAIIEYEIPSNDGTTILKTSYENFADLANRVFNIPTITRLNVTTYANRFTDAFGKPNVFAVKLQLTKETNAKINWSVKKYAYSDYQTILDKQEINPSLSKDYIALTKKTS